jgi:hypothetical protein
MGNGVAINWLPAGDSVKDKVNMVWGKVMPIYESIVAVWEPGAF